MYIHGGEKRDYFPLWSKISNKDIQELRGCYLRGLFLPLVEQPIKSEEGFLGWRKEPKFAEWNTCLNLQHQCPKISLG